MPPWTRPRERATALARGDAGKECSGMIEPTGQNSLSSQKKGFNFRNWTILYMDAALFLFLTLPRPNFLTFNNIHSLFFETAFLFFASIGFTLLIIMGELDLSVGSMFGFGGSMLGFFVFSWKLPAGAAIALAVLLAGLIGFAAGALVTAFRVNSMMVTIGVMIAVKGFNWMLINMFMGRQLPAAARGFISATVADISWMVWLMLFAAAVFEVFLNRSKPLKQLYYIGHSSDTAVIFGINTNLVKHICFAASAALSAFGGALMTARVKAPNVTVGSNLEIRILTAAVISGASIYGGRGSVLRTMLGVLFVFMLQNGMTAYRIGSYIQQIILGGILVLAIYFDIRMNKKKA
jgi:ribose transport system permease protein